MVLRAVFKEEVAGGESQAMHSFFLKKKLCSLQAEFVLVELQTLLLNDF
jgi:hypothetical protein